MNKSMVAVTGASGMVGKAVVRKLIELGYRVRILVHNKKTNFNNNVEEIIGDIDDLKILRTVLRGVDGVIHCAVVMDKSLPWDMFYKINVKSVNSILENADKNTKILMVSSVAVYDDTGKIERDESFKLRHHTADKYLKSKIDALNIIRKSKRKVVTVMPSIVIDKTILGKQKLITKNFLLKLVWEFIGGGIPGGIMGAVGNRNRIMNVVELDDVANGIVKAWVKGDVGEEYILSGQNICTGDYLNYMAKKSGNRPTRFRIPMIFLKLVGLEKLINMNFSYKKANLKFGYKPMWKLWS